jgi:hypothetical protein
MYTMEPCRTLSKLQTLRAGSDASIFALSAGLRYIILPVGVKEKYSFKTAV